MQQEVTMLRCLKPGDMFKREGGDFRYIVSRECIGSGGNEQIYCYNLDGSSNGYYHQGNERVILLTPLGAPCTPRCPREYAYPFWMCYVEGSGMPTMRHLSHQAAVTEAERLARVTGKPVYLLHASSYVTFVPPIIAARVAQWQKL